MTEFTIVLRRDSVDESLGADVSMAVASEALRIEGVDEMGSIGDWNTRHPDKAVQVGDLFVAFNGIRGSQAMLEELRKQPTLEVTVERLAEEDEDWDEEQSQYEGLLEAAKKAEQTNRRKCRALESEMTSDIIRGSKVVCATLAGCGSDALKMFKFNAVLVDEATQASEPRALIAVKSLTQEGRLVLVGDQKQLPPTCVCRDAADMGLSLSLFERLLRKDDHLKPVMLTTQFRMHPIISQWPSKAFYQNKLMNGQQAVDRVPAPGFNWPSAGPAAFIEVEGKEEKSLDGASKINREEIDMVRKVVDSFLKEMEPRDIGVISPYRGQVGQLKKLLPKGVEAKTVDGFQGREKPVIIFSCVRSNPKGAVGFLKDKRRLNVALTRAQRGLVVIGDPNTLKSNQVWSSWLEFVKENNLTVDFP
jgi:superfamily I DNA and/or RNA helicase